MSKAWIVATSIAAVEGLKDQGISSRWNYTLKSLQQHVKNNMRCFSTQAMKLSSTSNSAAAVANMVKEEKFKQSEESLKNVMYLNCWGPN